MGKGGPMHSARTLVGIVQPTVATGSATREQPFEHTVKNLPAYGRFEVQCRARVVEATGGEAGVSSTPDCSQWLVVARGDGCQATIPTCAQAIDGQLQVSGQKASGGLAGRSGAASSQRGPTRMACRVV